jgi:hypothetical protein
LTTEATSKFFCAELERVGGALVKALIELHQELVRIYGFNSELLAALNAWSGFLTNILGNGVSTPTSKIFFGRGHPEKDPFQYSAPIGDLIAKAQKDGPNHQMLCRMGIAFAYSYWEHCARPAIALEVGCRTAEIANPTFGDLRKYRNAVLHVGGRLDSKMEKLDLFSIGETLTFTEEKFYLLFKELVNALNTISSNYYNQETNFDLDIELR